MCVNLCLGNELVHALDLILLFLDLSSASQEETNHLCRVGQQGFIAVTRLGVELAQGLVAGGVGNRGLPLALRRLQRQIVAGLR